jgi:hypothetical protein
MNVDPTVKSLVAVRGPYASTTAVSEDILLTVLLMLGPIRTFRFATGNLAWIAPSYLDQFSARVADITKRATTIAEYDTIRHWLYTRLEEAERG